MSFRHLFAATTFAAFTAAGCAGEVDPEAAPSQVAATLSSADSALVLDLVNYPGADLATLDDTVGLDGRAAENIEEHRAGADGIFPSADDDLFDDVAELDAIPYVGDSAFSKLIGYARANPAPAPESVEGVSFRGWESEIVVWGVNTLDLAVLDESIDGRAAENLINERPFANVTEMGPLGYVGPFALQQLRGRAATWWAARAGSAGSLAGTFDGVAFDQATAVIAIEIANQATLDELVGHGVYSSGSAAMVGNRPYTTLAQVAAVSGIGTKTMQGLHDYATSGAWTSTGGGGGEEPPPSGHTPPDPNCVFGLVYGDIFTLGGTIIIAKRVIDPATSTNATQRAQVVAAVQSAIPDVTTFSGALAAVDDSKVNQVEIWDGSNRLPYTAYEFGAGDNSFGMVFAYGTTTSAAQIIDGDLYDCSAMWGNEMRTCERTADCATGLTCNGMSETVATGRCINLAAPDHPLEGTSCSLESGCAPATGLVCAGATSPWGDGLCRPAWMKGHFESGTGDVSIPDASTAGATLELPVFGLATVNTDVLIDLTVDHPRISDLRVTLTNPATAEVLVFDGAGASAAGLYFKDRIVLGFSGDEMVNGVWTLKVEDRSAGSAGQITHFALTITSRWD